MSKPVFKTLKDSALIKDSFSDMEAGSGGKKIKPSMKAKNPGINFGKWTPEENE